MWFGYMVPSVFLCARGGVSGGCLSLLCSLRRRVAVPFFLLAVAHFFLFLFLDWCRCFSFCLLKSLGRCVCFVLDKLLEFCLLFIQGSHEI